MFLCQVENGFVFSRSNIETNAPNQAGIYIFWSGKFCVYVGQARDLRARLLTHWKRSHNDDLHIWIKALGSRLCISYEVVNSDLGRAEQSRINRYQPHLNKINARAK